MHLYVCDPGPQNQSYVAGVYCSNSQNYIAWVKIIDFYFMPKIIRILSKEDICSMKIFSKCITVNISKLIFE